MLAIGKVDKSVLWRSYKGRLVAALKRAEAEQQAKTPAETVDPAIGEMLDKAKDDDWNELHAVEQRLLPYIAAADIDAEFARRAVEAEDFGLKSLPALKAGFERAEKDDTALRRSLLRCLLENLHYRYIQRELDRATRTRTITSYIVAGLALSVVFAAVLVWGAKSPEVSDKRVLNVPFVMLIGLCGAYFSRLTTLSSNVDIDYDTLMSSYRFKSLVLRGGVGMLAAAVVYYLIYSGLIAGDLFPESLKISDIVSMFGGAEPMVPAKDTAKLMVWCFVAGFSERFVSGTLERLEKTDTAKAA